jgi:NAD-dependent deacetylase sirtuin 5
LHELLVAGLYQRAGFSDDQIAQIHGTLFEMKCSKYASDQNDRCGYSTPITYPVNDALTTPTDVGGASISLPRLNPSQLSHCPECGKLTRPGVVLFGESISTALMGAIHTFISAGPLDLLLVVGTSAVVLPAAMYIPMARNAGARVAYFNMEEYFDEPGCVWA